MSGSLALVLHAHLPWVRHPEHPHFLEEDWLYEAMSETYIPILAMMDDLARDGVPFALTMSLTPPLCEMLADPLLQSRYSERLEALRNLAISLRDEKRGTAFEDAAIDSLAHIEKIRSVWHDHYGRDLIAGFRKHQDAGRLVIVTCGATHGLLALAATDAGRRAQIRAAVDNYRKHFHRDPQGIWLGECAYQDGIDQFLAEANIRFFFVETHGVAWATPRPRFAHYRPIVTDAGVAVFGRDPACSKQVWSAESGYPGDPNYREFYRDAGWDAPLEWVKPLLGDGPRKNVGLKLHRVTGKVPLHEKEPYVPAWAAERAVSHARHFLATRQQQLAEIEASMGAEPLLVAPYDAELFGHWWSEGPQFLEALFRQAGDFPAVRFETPTSWLERHPECQIVKPCPSSWGDRGFWDVWLNGENAWIYKHLHRAEERMVELATRGPRSELETRAITQAGRQLLLAQSSDWAFIIAMKTTVPYAVKRTRLHLAAFEKLYRGLMQPGDHNALAQLVDELEAVTPVFSELDWRHWSLRTDHSPAGVASDLIG